MRRKSLQRHDGGRPAAVVYCVCAVYLYCVGSLLAWASLPVLTGMTPTLIISGSMGPAITTGDVVMVGSADGHTVERGHVITFDDPAHPGRLLTHRVAAVNADGTYRTRGDANAHPDSTRVQPEAVVGVGRILVPAVGVPLVWIRTQAWLNLLLWVGGSFLALGYLRAYGHRLPVVSRWSTPLILPPAERRPPHETPERQWERPVLTRWRLRSAMPVAVVVLGLVAVVLPRLTDSHAAFTSATSNPDNSWAASSDFCGSTLTLHPTADARIADNSATPNGSAITIGVANKSPTAKSLLAFDVPAATGCTLTSATLRLQIQTGTAGRTLSAAAVSATWDEATVVWGSQPGVTAEPPATAPSAAAAGTWVTFAVTPHAEQIRAGTAHGFVVSSDAGGPPGTAQTFHSREGATGHPELVLEFTGPTPPAAPTGLSAAAETATRIVLDWTDTSGGVAGFRIERSLGGAGTWTVIDSVVAGITTFTDTGLDPSTTYDYRVRATDTGGLSDPSNVASATTPAAPTPPASPTGLTATATGVETVDVSWTDVSANEDGFLIQRSPAGAGVWTEAGSVGPDVITFADGGLTAGTAYDYRVRAFNAGGDSAWTAVASATTDGCATLAPQTLTSEADSLILGGTSADTNFGASAPNFGVRSYSAGNGRSLVRFPAPTIAGGCAVTGATLRLLPASTVSGRTLQALAVDVAWDEATVTWNTGVTASGTPATVVTDDTLAWREWDVTALVGSTGTGAPHGFLLRDAVEDEPTAVDNGLTPKEAGTNAPELVITFE